jgi:hypothetical protein
MMLGRIPSGCHFLAVTLLLSVLLVSFSAIRIPRQALPRAADGKPNLQGVWKAGNTTAASDIQGVVEGGDLPYTPAAAEKKRENFKNRQTADPLSKCYMPGVPRIMYLDYPFHIFQTKDHVAITFEWSSVFRLIYLATKTSPHPGVDSWMGDSRGRWEGDTLVVDVIGHNDRTWFDLAGNFHSDKMRLTERYTLVDPDTIRYEVSVTDPNVFTRPWKISMPLHRIKNMNRILEYQCQAEKEEKSGDFERDSRTWYPGR